MFLSFSEQNVFAAFKMTNSKDPDVLATAKDTMLAQAKIGKVVFWIFLVSGVAISLTIIGAIFGIPLIVVSYFINKRVKNGKKTIEDAYKKYLTQIGVEAR